MTNSVNQDDLSNDYWTIPEGYLAGCYTVVQRDVNMDDLARARPGAIVRVLTQDAIRYFPAVLDDYERIAGLISDAA